MTDLRVCFIGDSFTYGQGDPEGLGWVGRVVNAAQADGVEFAAYNLGVPGDTSWDIRQRWLGQAERCFEGTDEGRLVFCFGANDVVWTDDGPRENPADSLANLVAILEDASPWPTVVIGSPPLSPWLAHDDLPGLMDRFAQSCADLRVPFLPVLAPLTAEGSWLTEAEATDGAHPGAGGYEAMAKLVIRWEGWQRLLG
jgi:lysophospholipase L1-like esterase